MPLTFTARRPKPLKPSVAPLGEPAGSTGRPPPAKPERRTERPKELGGPSGPEPTRYGDWERKGICVDF